MLSILTAAETEMYESSKKHEESAMAKSGPIPKPMRDASVNVQLISANEFTLLQETVKEF